ncbi:MAG: right-handed parallel beta-helix repeat-containing protein, partial [Myxococcota bacterium]
MTKRMCLAIRRLAGLMVLAGLLSLAAPASAANYPLEITQPQPNLSTVNRFYKAYPGLMYRVRLAVIGGLYPYRFSLGTAPAGMEIDPNDGTITWANPTESGSPHQVQATVLDSEGSSQSVSWTITVTTQGFRFVDAINGRTVAEGGTGTFANPWKTIVDWYEGNVYESKRAQSYVNEFLYWREGVYSLANVYTEDGTPGQDPGRLPVLSAYKPVVWLAYPGEKPIVDHGYTGALDTGPFIIFYASSANVYVDGLEFRNMKCKGIELAPDGNNQVFANLDMHDMHYGEDGKNCAFIMTGSGGGGATPSDHMVIQSSTFHHMNLASAGAMIKIYSKNKLLIEDNTLHTVTGTTDSEGIALKGGTMTRVTVRHNVVHDVPRKSIGGNMHTLVDSELLYNCIYDAANEGLDINQDGLATNLYIYRNTVLGRVQVRNTDSADGPFRFYNNIFVNDDPGTPP